MFVRQPPGGVAGGHVILRTGVRIAALWRDRDRIQDAQPHPHIPRMYRKQQKTIMTSNESFRFTSWLAHKI